VPLEPLTVPLRSEGAPELIDLLTDSVRGGCWSTAGIVAAASRDS
jgi:hypothetical protein